jgi:hypothetical protein
MAGILNEELEKKSNWTIVFTGISPLESSLSKREKTTRVKKRR